MVSWVRKVWHLLREITGDDAYERYVAHWKASHAHEGGRPMSRKEFSAAEIQRRWSGIKRCC